MEYLKRMLIICLIIGFINTGFSKPATKTDAEEYDYVQSDDDYNYDEDKSADKEAEDTPPIENNDTVNKNPPFFEVTDLSEEVNVGDNAVLHCDVKNFQLENVVLWYNGSNLLTQSRYILGNKDRIKLLENNAIGIQNVEVTDSNDYYCVVHPQNIRLHIHLNVLPVQGRVSIFSSNRDVTERSMTLRSGVPVEFECRTSGVKDAVIKWSLNGNRADDFVSKIVDGKIIIDEVGAEHAGLYQCLGDDGSATPPHGSVTVNVLYAPRVSTHRHHVNTELATSAELYCDYKAEPIAISIWKKNGRYLPEFSDKYAVKKTEHKGKNRTVLIVKNVESVDLGEYECEVNNTIGAAEVKIHLIQEPENPQFESMIIEGRKVTLYWLVRSMQPLTEAVLDYQIDGSYSWSTESIISSQKHPEHTGIWKLRHEIELTPGLWHARVRTRNTVGWSKFSLQHDFRIDDESDEGFDDDNSIPDDMVVAAGIGQSSKKNNSSSSSQLTVVPSIVLGFSLFAYLSCLVPFGKVL